MSLTIGVDLGGTRIKVGIVDTCSGSLQQWANCPTRAGRPALEVFEDIAALCLKLCKKQGIDSRRLQSIGIGLPGIIDSQKKEIVYSANLGMKNIDIQQIFKHLCDGAFSGARLYVDNDANCAAIAESVSGAAKDHDNSVTMTLGTGVGVGVIQNRRVFVSSNWLAPEWGHVIMVADGAPCPCGRRGCMERYVSASALVAQTKQAALDNASSVLHTWMNTTVLSAKSPFEAARLGDVTGQAVVDQYIHYLAIAISNIIYGMGPDIIVLGGGVCNEGDALLIPLQKEVERNLMSSSRNMVAVALAAYKNDAGMIGSALLHTLNS